jgi:deoxyribodipyrimidine photo-lyase
MGQRPIIVWFRRDLRVSDNPALLHAARRGSPVVPVFAADWEAGDKWAPGPAGRWWLERSLGSLADSLEALGAPLVTFSGAPAEGLLALAQAVGAGEVVCNRLYEPYSVELDRQVSAALERAGVGFTSFNAGLLFEPEDAVSRAGKPFAQFTAFWRSCLSLPEPEPPMPGPAGLRGAAGLWALEDPRPPWPRGAPRAAGGETVCYALASVWQPGEAGAQARLQTFLEDVLPRYGSSRDFPGVEGTSRLSPHLHFGEVGPGQVWHAVREAGSVEGGAAFLRQLGWREFAHNLLFHFPWTTERPFRPEFAGFPWEDDPTGFEAWTQGGTGYPFVDAGMRQLLAEGWMHNRARMVTASFLTKDLLIPWQRGAAWFWDHLVDADLANNTLGWQWTAGSGPDAAPYFRVFNPALQARRFDGDAAYARRWAPSDGRAGLDPGGRRPIVEHDEARARALAAFRGLRASR